MKRSIFLTASSLSRRIPISSQFMGHSIIRHFSSPTLEDHQKIRENLKLNDNFGSSLTQVHQKISGRARFYKNVDIVEENGKYKILLDGRNLRTPARNPVVVESLPLALALAVEWDRQTDKKKGIEPATMPLMTIYSTANDQVVNDREYYIKTCMRYLPTDSCLFFTTEQDRVLLSKQKKYLMPAIKNVSRLIREKIEPTSQMTSRINHPEIVTKKVEYILRKLDNNTLTLCNIITSECKSIILALNFIFDLLTLEQIVTASRIEEEFQVEIWGVVEGGHDMDRLNNSVNLSSAKFFSSMVNPNGINHIVQDPEFKNLQ